MAYNGWTNWATWNVELWLDNEEPLYRAKQAYIRHARDISAETVALFCYDVFPSGTPDMKHPSEMATVNWQELADSWREEKNEAAA
jgi:hypothetical protein